VYSRADWIERVPEGLAALVLFLRKAPTLEKFWNVMVGNPENRRIARQKDTRRCIS
jgi:hypothetical protein